MGPAWRFWTSAHGLGESYVRNLHQDAEGRVWFSLGSVGLFSMLDGYTVQTFPYSLTGRQILGSAAGQAWALDQNSLLHFENNQWKSYSLDKLPGFPSGGPVRGLCPLGLDEVVLMFDDRLLLFNRKTGKCETLVEAGETGVGEYREILPRLDGNGFWIGARRGIVAATRIGEGRTGIRLRSWPSPAGLGSFSRMHEGDGELFVTGQERGQNVIARVVNGSWEIVFSSPVTNLEGWRGPGQVIWIRQNDELFTLANNGLRPVKRSEVLSGNILSIFSGRKGEFWVGTSQGAAHCLSNIWLTPPELSELDTIPYSVCQDRRGRIWAAYRDTLAVLENERWRRISLPLNLSIRSTGTESIVPLSDDHLIICADARGISPSPTLLRFNPESERFYPVPHPEGLPVRMFFPRADGTLLVHCGGTSSYRVDVFDGTTFRPYVHLGEDRIGDFRTLYEADNADLWIGGLQGILRYRRGKTEVFGAKELGEKNGVFTLNQGRPGRIWIGARDELLEYDGQSWRPLLQNVDRVRTIFPSPGGDVWVASGTGLHRLRNGQWITYTAEDGLPSSMAWEVFEDQDGRIWCGTTLGLAVHQPEADRDAPETFIPLDRNLRETPPGGSVRLRFTGSDRWKQTHDERLLFSFRLDKGSWTDFGVNAFAAFNELESGEHLFEVRTMDRNGNIDPTPAAFAFTVLSPWYFQKGFLTILTLSAVAIFVLVRRIVGDFKDRGRMIAELTSANRQVEDRTAQLASANDNIRRELEERQKAERNARESEAKIRELYDQLAYAVAELTQGIGEVATMATDLAEGSRQISNASQALASGSAEQAGAVQEISSALKMVAAGTLETRNHAEKLGKLADTAQRTTSVGVSRMAELSTAVERIKSSSDQTGHVIKAIREIAFQTNLLSLNAAVEAARAGEAGRGFAVVAEEVRNLAIRSAQAAKESEELIEEAQRHAEHGVQLNLQVAEGLHAIEQQVKTVTEVLKTVKETLEDQSTQLDEIARGMDQINKVTQSAAGSAEESAGAAAEIAQHAAHLENVANKLSSAVADLNRLPGSSQRSLGGALIDR